MIARYHGFRAIVRDADLSRPAAGKRLYMASDKIKTLAHCAILHLIALGQRGDCAGDGCEFSRAGFIQAGSEQRMAV